MFERLKWTKGDTCQVCEHKLPEGYTGYIGTGPGLHVVIVAWTDNGQPRADGAVTHMWQGVVRRLTPEEASQAAEAAHKAIMEGRTHDKEGTC